jgi:hypothetical protein
LLLFVSRAERPALYIHNALAIDHSFIPTGTYFSQLVHKLGVSYPDSQNPGSRLIVLYPDTNSDKEHFAPTLT